MRKIISAFLILSVLLSALTLFTFASDDESSLEDMTAGAEEICKSVKSAVLMDASTGRVIYEKEGATALPPASVTKVMTLLLVAEAIENGSISADQRVTVSTHAASMGGSQVFLKEGEEFSVEELLKCAVIASANDASVALAELVGGTEESFVAMMNDRAAELGLKSSYFENCTGLDDDVERHLLSAIDIATLSRELISHPIILKYSCLWQDSIRDGEFILTNTNRLVRYYKGCTGLKTGSTDKAGFCVSATAEREGMHLIAVVMGAETREDRNECARALLDFGFAGYSLYTDPECDLEQVPVNKGSRVFVTVKKEAFYTLIKRSDASSIEKRYTIPNSVDAPFAEGDIVGLVEYFVGDTKLGECNILVTESAEKISLIDVFLSILGVIISGK